MKEPNWLITLIIGALLGFLPEIITIIKNIVYRFSKNRLVGTWHVYEVTIHNNNKINTYGICTIKNGFLHRYKISMKNGALVYKGIGEVEENHLYMKLQNQNDNNVRTETCWQRYDFSYNDYNLMCGLWLSNNYDNNTTCGISILSRDSLDETSLEKIKKEHFHTKWESIMFVKT